MKINSLLNPSCEEILASKVFHTSPPSTITHVGAWSTPSRRHKLAKDAPIFSEGNRVVGIVNYPPHEEVSHPRLHIEHRRFQVFPLGEIARKGARHIPYNSDKKDFLDKTGRDAFEMFQYTYKRPGEDKEYVVVWDYNVGLVRMTPFFKSCKYSKTIPAKALRENTGLKEISYSITGGALVCQGYWMPYQAAKAIAATFCYDIRWALTPVFGVDFPSLCLRPNDPNFAKFLIDPAIVQFCAAETTRFREEGPSYRISRPIASPRQEAPRMQFGSPPWGTRASRQKQNRPADIESGYGTDTDQSDKAFISPQVSPRSAWHPINASQASCSPHTVNSSAMNSPNTMGSPPTINFPRLEPVLEYDAPIRTKRKQSRVAPNEEEQMRPQTASTFPSCRKWDDGEKDHKFTTQDEVEVVNALLSMKSGLLLPPTKRTRRGSTL